jgi:hypothetical protein
MSYEFSWPFHVLFVRDDQGLPVPCGDTEGIITVILFWNKRIQSRLRDQVDTHPKLKLLPYIGSRKEYGILGFSGVQHLLTDTYSQSTLG